MRKRALLRPLALILIFAIFAYLIVEVTRKEIFPPTLLSSIMVFIITITAVIIALVILLGREVKK